MGRVTSPHAAARLVELGKPSAYGSTSSSDTAAQHKESSASMYSFTNMTAQQNSYISTNVLTL